MRNRAARRLPPSVARQRGAVLYIALIMLVLMTLIGLVALQVASMQERMAANYYAVNHAFQNTEALVRLVECNVEDTENGVPLSCVDKLSSVAISYNCEDGFDPGVWVSDRTLESGWAINVRKIDQCVVGESPIAMGVGPEGEVSPVSTYQITGYETDMADRPLPATTAAAIDTIFRL